MDLRHVRRGMVLGLVSLALAACSPSGGPTPSQSTTPATRQAVGSFNVAVAVPGIADPHDATFLRDQQGLYDAAQLSDPAYYQAGWHWKIDPTLGPRAIASAKALYDSQSAQWAVLITFTQAAAQRWAAITEAAYQAGQGTPRNRIAVFLGTRILTAPAVIAPSSTETEVTGNFDEQTAKQVAEALVAAAK